MSAERVSALRVLLRPQMLLLHVLAGGAVTLALLLGLWQYNVWHDHRSDQAATLARAEPEPLDDVLTPDAAFPREGIGQPVSFKGRWLAGKSFYVSGRELDGRDGLWAVTPLAVCRVGGAGAEPAGCAEAPLMLVVRGWVPTRDAAPPPPSGSADVVDVVGWLQPPEVEPGEDAAPGDDVLPTLRLPDLLDRFDNDLYGGFVIAETVTDAATGTPHAASTEGLEQVTPDSLPKPTAFTSLRNLLYGLEWWVFGGFAVFLWWRWCRDEVERARTPVPQTGQVPSGP